MPPVAVSTEAVHTLLARWFPGQRVDLVRLGQGVSTPVYRVVANGVTTYLRLAEGPGERRDAEALAHAMIRERGVSVPEVIRFEPEPPELDRSAALTSAMPGMPLGEFTGDPASALRAAGRDLARLNAIPVTGYGWADRVEGEGRRLAAEHPTRAAWAREYLAAVDAVIAAGVLPVDRSEPLATAIHAWADLPDDGSSRLAHGDFDTSHIFVAPETGIYKGLIDFGEIRGADRMYDLGHLLLHDGGGSFDAVAAGYAEVAPVDVAAVRLQAIAIAARALAIQLGRAPNAYREFLRERLGALLDQGR